MEPVTPLTLLIYVPAFLAMLALYGNPLRIFFEKYLDKKNIALDTVERIALTLASGAAIIPLIIMVLSFIGNILSTFVVQVLTVVFIATNLYFYKGRLESFKPKLIKPSVKTVTVSLTFLAILIFHLYPLQGLFVHPGCDPALYSLITLRIVESGGYTTSWGFFAPPAWYVEKIHLIIAGFSGTCAYFHLLTGLSIEKAVSIITLIYTSLISLGVYFLVKRLFKSISIALCSAFSFGMLMREPGLAWFGWGGHAELSSLFLLPVIIGLFWELLHNDDVGFQYMFFLGFLLSGMYLLHTYAAFYLLFCLIPFFIIFAFTQRKIAPILKSLTVFPLSIIFILPIFVPAVVNEIVVSQLYATVYTSRPYPKLWSSMISWNQSPEQLLYSVLWRLFAVYGIATFFLLIAGINALRHRKIDREPLILLGAWALTLFLVHENFPTGLYVIPFPLWSRIDPNRTFTITSFAASIIIGIGISKIIEGFKEKSIPPKKKIISHTLHIKKVIVIITIVLLCVAQVCIGVIENSISRGKSPITEADIIAFNWIKEKTPKDAVFFVSRSDAGYWIPIFAFRRVVIPFGVVTNYTLHDYYRDEIFPTFCKDPQDLKCIKFLNYHNVDYVYVGSKTISYPTLRGGFNSTLLEKSPLFSIVYNQSNVYIFKYLGSIQDLGLVKLLNLQVSPRNKGD